MPSICTIISSEGSVYAEIQLFNIECCCVHCTSLNKLKVTPEAIIRRIFGLFNREECRHVFVVDPQSIRAEFLGEAPFHLSDFIEMAGPTAIADDLEARVLVCGWCSLHQFVVQPQYSWSIGGLNLADLQGWFHRC